MNRKLKERKKEEDRVRERRSGEERSRGRMWVEEDARGWKRMYDVENGLKEELCKTGRKDKQT